MTQTFANLQVLTVLGGSAVFDARSLVMGSRAEHVGWQDSWEFMLLPLLNSLKGAAETGLSARSLTRALALCVGGVVPLSCAVSGWLPYTHGGASALNNPWMLAGAAVVLLLFVCRACLPAFGLHPTGFLVAASYALYCLWFSLFLGLVLGDCVSALAWVAVGLLTGKGYQLMPG